MAGVPSVASLVATTGYRCLASPACRAARWHQCQILSLFGNPDGRLNFGVFAYVSGSPTLLTDGMPDASFRQATSSRVRDWRVRSSPDTVFWVIPSRLERSRWRGGCPYRKHQRELRPPGAVLNHWARQSRTGSGWPKRTSQKLRVHCELRESPMSAVSTDRGLIRLIRDVRRTANCQSPLRRLGVRTGGAARQDEGWRPPDRVPAAESSVPLGCPWPARDVCGCRGSRRDRT